MFTIAVVDLSADGRKTLIERVSRVLSENPAVLALLPRVDIKPASLSELKFVRAPHLVVVGREIVTQHMLEIASVRKLFPDVPVLACTDGGEEDLGSIEDLARLGVSDTIGPETSSVEILKKLVFLSRRAAEERSGTLVLVDGGKGGVGVTSVVAGLAELIVERNKRVVVVDLDFESQDLSRFLQARPCVNENLDHLLLGTRPIVSEAVEQCLVRVWMDTDGLSVMPPPTESDTVHDPRSGMTRAFLGVLEVLDSLSDVVIVDLAGVRGGLRQALYRVADRILFVVNNDPATVFASVDRVSRVKSLLGSSSDLLVVENGSGSGGLASTILKGEFLRASGIEECSWSSTAIPFCRLGARWPGSSGTLVSQGRGGIADAFSRIATELGLITDPLPVKRGLDLSSLFRWRYSNSSRPAVSPVIGSVTPVALPNQPLGLPSVRSTTTQDSPHPKALDIKALIGEVKVM